MNNEKVEEFIKSLENLQQKIDDGDEVFSIEKELTDVLMNITNETRVSSGLEIKIKKLHPKAIIPKYAKDGDAGLDLTATSIINETDDLIEYGLGIAIEIPKNYVGLIFPRSSVTKTTLMLKNCVGVIDSGYRGEIKATFEKFDIQENKYSVGDRICQIIIIPYPQVSFIEVDELTETERGTGGYGSTGK